MTNKPKRIRVINKTGRFISFIPLYKAEFSVKRGKSKWVSSDTIQVLYHYEDLKRFKQDVWNRDGYVCYICEKQMHQGHPELTVDHMNPQRSGGSVLPENQATCCRPCNEEKAGRSVERYTRELLLSIYAAYLLTCGEGGTKIGKGKQKSRNSETSRTHSQSQHLLPRRRHVQAGGTREAGRRTRH